VTAVREWVSGLPPVIRWGIGGGVGILILTALGAAAWSWIEHREASAQRSLAPVVASANQALGGGDKGALETAAASLKQFLKDYPRSRVAAEAWYVLGNVDFQRASLDTAASAFDEARRRGRGSVAALSQLGLGYVREARGELSQALTAYDQGLSGRVPTAFLYPDLLLAKARVQEQLKDTAGAIESYKRFLKEVPAFNQAEEVRIRLGILGASG
jgi:tetratricopeptide (TPR) repeat protein